MSWARKAPRWAIVISYAIAAILVGVGARTHIVDFLSKGLHPYPWAPNWLNYYWTSLAVFDALAAVLLLMGRRVGGYLTLGVVFTDLAANFYAIQVIQGHSVLTDPGLQRVAAFTTFVVVAMVMMRRHLA